MILPERACRGRRATSATLPSLRRRQQDHAVAQLLLELIDAVAQRLRVEPVEARRDDLDAVDVLAPARRDRAVAELAAFAFNDSSSRSSFFWRSNSWRSFSTTSSPLADSRSPICVEARFFFGDIRQRARAGHRLDAAHAGGDAALADDLEQADVAGARDVRAAAQFGREIAHLQHAHSSPYFSPNSAIAPNSIASW